MHLTGLQLRTPDIRSSTGERETPAPGMERRSPPSRQGIFPRFW
jgi:hypothetical protein